MFNKAQAAKALHNSAKRAFEQMRRDVPSQEERTTHRYEPLLFKEILISQAVGHYLTLRGSARYIESLTLREKVLKEARLELKKLVTPEGCVRPEEIDSTEEEITMLLSLP